MSYTALDQRFWVDEAIADLDDDRTGAILLFLWSMSNGQCASMTGLTLASRSRMARVAGVHDVAGALERLGRKPLALYDDEHEVLWCVNRVEWACRSWSQARGALKYVAEFAPCPLVAAFRDRYGARLRDMATISS